MPYGFFVVPLPTLVWWGPYLGGFGHYNLPYASGLMYPGFTFPDVCPPPEF